MKPVTDEEKEFILCKLGRDPHYLLDKPIAEWDKYDESNWNGIVRNTIFENGL